MGVLALLIVYKTCHIHSHACLVAPCTPFLFALTKDFHCLLHVISGNVTLSNTLKIFYGSQTYIGPLLCRRSGARESGEEKPLDGAYTSPLRRTTVVATHRQRVLVAEFYSAYKKSNRHHS